MLSKGIQAGESHTSPGSSSSPALGPVLPALGALGMALYRQHPPNSLQVLPGKGGVFSERELCNCHFWAALKISFLTCKFLNLSFCSISMPKVSCLFYLLFFPQDICSSQNGFCRHMLFQKATAVFRVLPGNILGVKFYFSPELLLAWCSSAVGFFLVAISSFFIAFISTPTPHHHIE